MYVIDFLCILKRDEGNVLVKNLSLNPQLKKKQKMFMTLIHILTFYINL